MQVHIKATGVDFTPALEKYIIKRIGGLRKFFRRFEAESEVDVYLEIARTTKRHKSGEVFYAEVNVDLHGHTIRVEHSNTDVRAAIDGLKDVLKREVHKYKDKRVSKKRSVKRPLKPK